MGIKIHLDNWPSLCMKKEFGGVGVPDLNVCLLGSGLNNSLRLRAVYGKRSLRLNIILGVLICSVVMMPSLLNLGRRHVGL